MTRWLDYFSNILPYNYENLSNSIKICQIGPIVFFGKDTSKKIAKDNIFFAKVVFLANLVTLSAAGCAVDRLLINES